MYPQLFLDIQFGEPQGGLLLLLGGLPAVLLQLLAALRHVPGVQPTQRRTVGPPARRLQLLPVRTPGPRPNPRLGAHEQAGAPGVVLGGAGGQAAAALRAQRLGDGADVVGLKAAAAA